MRSCEGRFREFVGSNGYGEQLQATRNKSMHIMNGNTTTSSAAQACSFSTEAIWVVAGVPCTKCNKIKQRGSRLSTCSTCERYRCKECAPAWERCPGPPAIPRKKGKAKSKAKAKVKAAGGEGQQRLRALAAPQAAVKLESTPAAALVAGEVAATAAPMVVHLASAGGDAAASSGGQQTHLGEWWGDTFAPTATRQESVEGAVEDLWEQVGGRPAMRTAIWAPRSVAPRVAGILVQTMNDLLSYGTGEGHDPVAVRQAAIRLWAMPSLLLRREDGTSRGQRERGQLGRRERGQASHWGTCRRRRWSCGAAP